MQWAPSIRDRMLWVRQIAVRVSKGTRTPGRETMVSKRASLGIRPAALRVLIADSKALHSAASERG